MRADEGRSLGTLAGSVVAGAANRAKEMHFAILDRATPDSVGQYRTVHRALAGSIYDTVATGGAALGWLAGRLAATSMAVDAPSLGESSGGNLIQSGVNAYCGDRLASTDSSLAIAMAIRSGGRDVPLRTERLVAAFPATRPRLVVFVHGLAENENSWCRGRRAERAAADASYATRIAHDLDRTCLLLRYNTGRHISDNGHELAALLSELVDQWPVPVQEIAFIGHSMGGLVVRSACHQAQQLDLGWTSLVRHVVCLGSPHLGAPAERAANGVGWLLGRVPEATPLSHIVNLRSAGIKDLRYGALCAEHWTGSDPDALWRDQVSDVEQLQGSATHFCVSANVGSTENHVLGKAFGDLLVPVSSATGSGRSKRRRPLIFDDARHFVGLNHFDLLNHPDVYAQLAAWLEAE